MNIKILKAALVGLILSVSSLSNAGLIVVDNGATLTATWDETFSLTRDMDTSGLVHAIVFDNMFADDFTSGNPVNGIYNIRASVNGGADIVLNPWSGWNYRVTLDSPGNGWDSKSLAILWDPSNLGGALTGDSVRLFGSMTFDKNNIFHHTPDFSASTVSFTPYNTASFSDEQLVSNNSSTPVPEPSTLAIFALGIMGLASRRVLLMNKK